MKKRKTLLQRIVRLGYPQQIPEPADWAHVRRMFYDLQQAHASPEFVESRYFRIPGTPTAIGLTLSRLS